MKKIWDRLSSMSHYYIISMMSFIFFFSILNFINFDFLNVCFFTMSFIWHFALMTPGLTELVLHRKNRLSFLSVVVRVNYYLQLFIRADKIPFKGSMVRAISPVLFSFLLMVLTGNGKILFTLLGSFCFESVYFLAIKMGWLQNNNLFNLTSTLPDDQEIPPTIPSEESAHE